MRSGGSDDRTRWPDSRHATEPAHAVRGRCAASLPAPGHLAPAGRGAAPRLQPRQRCARTAGRPSRPTERLSSPRPARSRWPGALVARCTSQWAGPTRVLPDRGRRAGAQALDGRDQARARRPRPGASAVRGDGHGRRCAGRGRGRLAHRDCRRLVAGLVDVAHRGRTRHVGVGVCSRCHGEADQRIARARSRISSAVSSGTRPLSGDDQRPILGGSDHLRRHRCDGLHRGSRGRPAGVLVAVSDGAPRDRGRTTAFGQQPLRRRAAPPNRCSTSPQRQPRPASMRRAGLHAGAISWRAR